MGLTFVAASTALDVISRVPVQLPSLPQGHLCLHQSPNERGFGGVVWPGAALMCEWLAQQQLEGANVLELGSGTGACGLFAAGLGAQTVLLTDGGSDTLLNLIRENAERNKPLLGSSSVRVERLVWGDVADSCAVMSTSEPCDYILAADVLYGTGPLDATQRSEALAATFEAMLLCVPSDPPAAVGGTGRSGALRRGWSRSAAGDGAGEGTHAEQLPHLAREMAALCAPARATRPRLAPRRPRIDPEYRTRW